VICSCQGRQRQHTDLAVSPSPDLVSGISYLRLCVYHRHLDSVKASWRQYFFARPTRHDSARSWLLRLTNFPTYLLTYLLTYLQRVWNKKLSCRRETARCHWIGLFCKSLMVIANGTTQKFLHGFLFVLMAGRRTIAIIFLFPQEVFTF